MQKKRCPFFFFLEGLSEVSSLLSLSEPSSSPSDASMSTSCKGCDCVDLWELSRVSSDRSLGFPSCERLEEPMGEVGRLLLPFAAAKLSRVGVATPWSSEVNVVGPCDAWSRERGVVVAVMDLISEGGSLGPRELIGMGCRVVMATRYFADKPRALGN